MVQTLAVDPASGRLAPAFARFSPPTAVRLALALRRYRNGEFPDLDAPPARLLFIAWLIERGKLTDDLRDDG